MTKINKMKDRDANQISQITQGMDIREESGVVKGGNDVGLSNLDG